MNIFKNINRIWWPHGLKLKTLIKSVLRRHNLYSGFCIVFDENFEFFFKNLPPCSVAKKSDRILLEKLLKNHFY